MLLSEYMDSLVGSPTPLHDHAPPLTSHLSLSFYDPFHKYIENNFALNVSYFQEFGFVEENDRRLGAIAKNLRRDCTLKVVEDAWIVLILIYDSSGGGVPPDDLFVLFEDIPPPLAILDPPFASKVYSFLIHSSLVVCF